MQNDMYIVKTEIIRCQYYTLGGLFFTMVLAMEVFLALTRASPGSSYTVEIGVDSRLNSWKSCLFECFLLQNWWIFVDKIHQTYCQSLCHCFLLDKETGTHQIRRDVVVSKQCSGSFATWTACGSSCPLTGAVVRSLWDWDHSLIKREKDKLWEMQSRQVQRLQCWLTPENLKVFKQARAASAWHFSYY